MNTISVELKDEQPHKVRGRLVLRTLDSWRVCPLWWEGYLPRDYFRLDVEGIVTEIYRTSEGWYLSRPSGSKRS